MILGSKSQLTGLKGVQREGSEKSSTLPSFPDGSVENSASPAGLAPSFPALESSAQREDRVSLKLTYQKDARPGVPAALFFFFFLTETQIWLEISRRSDEYDTGAQSGATDDFSRLRAPNETVRFRRFMRGDPRCFFGGT